MKNLYPTLQLAAVLICLSLNHINAQTAPPAQTLTYSQPFAILGSVIVYPTGVQGWSFIGAASGSFRTAAPAGNSALLANSTAATTTGGVHNYTGKIGILATASVDPSLGIGVITTGLSAIQVKFDVMTIRNPQDGSANTSVSGIDLQYAVGSISNTWVSATGLANGCYQNNAVNQVSGTTPQNNQAKSFTLPAACDNQSLVYLRWVVRDISGTIGPNGRASFAIDNIVVCATVTPTIVITGPTAFCSSQSARYSAAITNGGTTPVYAWKKNGTTSVGTNSSILNISGLVAGNQITCVLTSNAQCASAANTTSNIITIGTVSNPPTISSAVIKKAGCVGERSGAINLTVNGGTPPYQICWDTTNIDHGSIFIVDVRSKTGANPLPGGNGLTYFTDNIESKELHLIKGITYSFNITGGHPYHISTDLNGGSNVGYVFDGQTGSQFGTGFGTITFTPNNFHNPLLYYPCAAHALMGWKINIEDGLVVEDPSNLLPGIYTVKVSDANGCTATASYTVGHSTSSAISASLNGFTDATCYGNADGTIDLEPFDGDAPYTASGTGPTFTVISQPKSHSHPYFGTGSGNGYTIDGVQGKELTLIRGIKYEFSLLTPGHPFFISSSSVGGSGNLASEITNGVINSMATSGSLFFTPNASHPALLYYQCGLHNNMGWKIHIVDQLPNADLGNCMAGEYNIFVTDAGGCSTTFPIQVFIGEPSATTFYYDNDHDGYGSDIETAIGCTAPTGFFEFNDDCNDNNAAINPGAPEICNGIDDDCDGDTDDDDTNLTGSYLYSDNDGDGYGDPFSSFISCTPQQGYVTDNTDCDDAHDFVHPGGTEICGNELDDDCDGLPDNCFININLSVFIEGYYKDNSQMKAAIDSVNYPNLCDTIDVDLALANAPHTAIYSQKATINTNGVGVFVFPYEAVGQTLYIVIHHRNTIEIWSKDAVLISDNMVFDFTME